MKQDHAASGWLARRDLVGFGAVGAALGVFTWRLVMPPALAPTDAMLSVTEARARSAAGDIVFIDIRRPDEWQATGVPVGAHPLDLRRADFIPALQAITGPDRSRPIALICARGVRSARLAEDLRAAGFTEILDVPEGMIGSAAGPGWLAQGLPVEIYEGVSE